MKNFFDKEILLTILLALLLGMFLGVFYNTKYSIPLRTFMHNMYIKSHPEIKDDSKTIIINKVSGKFSSLPQKDIFESKNNDNKFIMFIRKIFSKPVEKEKTIFDNF